MDNRLYSFLFCSRTRAGVVILLTVLSFGFQVEDFLTSNDIAVVAFLNGADSDEFKFFESVASTFSDDFPFAFTTNEEAAKSMFSLKLIHNS